MILRQEGEGKYDGRGQEELEGGSGRMDVTKIYTIYVYEIFQA